MSSSGRCLAGGVGVMLLLAGCGGSPVRSAPSPTSAAATAEPPGDVHADLPAPEPAPTDDASSDQAALDTAVTALSAFTRPDLEPESWWTALSPLLTPAAAAAYEGTDPQQVPASAVTGPPRGSPDSSAYLATVLVPTDAGEYAVLLVREGGGAPWLVERFTPVDAAAPSASGALPPPPDPAPPAEPAP
ncbi:hypothetical protein [Geodermatophilus ruber]|uniref:Lipoprotein n=1 Tax=Geodermatophilus ruber TaxID=504800 RepID=A0A1I4GCR6_9ACTN|nr:hypothetical protein [Geodermatophilus ruber]SFL26951.1 hypothetical protein SAMN04488085_108229 [Geodermatophilus ruber]